MITGWEDAGVISFTIPARSLELTDFPIWLSVPTQYAEEIISVLGENWEKIAVELESSGTQLSAEKIIWNTTTNTILLAIKATLLSSGDRTVNLYYKEDAEDNTTYIGAAGAMGVLVRSTIKLCMPAIGTDGSQSFNDLAGNSITVVGSTSPNIESDKDVVGGTSIYYGGSGHYLYAPYTAGCLGTGNFYVSVWVYIPSSFTPKESTIPIMCGGLQASNNSKGGWNFELFTSLKMRLEKTPVSGSSFSYNATLPNLTRDVWHKATMTRVSGALDMYWDGALCGSSTLFAGVDLPIPSTTYLYLGSAGNPVNYYYFTGYQDLITIDVGTGHDAEWEAAAYANELNTLVDNWAFPCYLTGPAITNPPLARRIVARDTGTSGDTIKIYGTTTSDETTGAWQIDGLPKKTMSIECHTDDGTGTCECYDGVTPGRS